MTREELVHAEDYLCRVLAQTFSWRNTHKRAALQTARYCVSAALLAHADKQKKRCWPK